MKLLLLATLLEAQDLLHALQAQPLEPGVYAYAEGKIIISGMGIPAAHTATLRWGPHADTILNLGIAGALKDFPLGKTLHIGTVGDASNSLSVSCAPFRLYTSATPLHNQAQKAALAPHWDLVDMEGYGIATAAHKLNKKCQLIKVVSDFASEGGSELIRQNLAYCAKLITQAFDTVRYTPLQ